MKQAVVEIADLESVVLTHNGVVVGYVTVDTSRNNSVEFVGRAVNIRRDYTTDTFHGFACGSSINTDDLTEVISAENFINAIAEVSK